jgi:hypothetical protein
MKTLKNLIIAFLVVTLSGCAIYGGKDRHGTSRYGNAEILGGTGAVIGAAVVESNPLLGAAGLGVAGYYLGRSMDRKEAAVGHTDCKAVIQRSYNRDGSISEVLVNDERCQSFKTTPGYRDGFNR